MLVYTSNTKRAASPCFLLLSFPPPPVLLDILACDRCGRCCCCCTVLTRRGLPALGANQHTHKKVGVRPRKEHVNTHTHRHMLTHTCTNSSSLLFTTHGRPARRQASPTIGAPRRETGARDASALAKRGFCERATTEKKTHVTSPATFPKQTTPTHARNAAKRKSVFGLLSRRGIPRKSSVAADSFNTDQPSASPRQTRNPRNHAVRAILPPFLPVRTSSPASSQEIKKRNE